MYKANGQGRKQREITSLNKVGKLRLRTNIKHTRQTTSLNNRGINEQE